MHTSTIVVIDYMCKQPALCDIMVFYQTILLN